MSKRKILFISIKRFKCHEFYTTLRKLGHDKNNWQNRYEILTRIESDAIKQFTKLALMIVVAYLMLTSLRNGYKLSLKVFNFEATVPVSYFLTSISFLLLLTIVSFCHLSVAMTLKARESGRILLSGFSASIYGLLNKSEDDVSFGVPLFSNYFIKEKLPISSLLGVGFLVGLFALLLPMIAFATFVTTEQLALLLDHSVPTIERLAVLAGIALTILSVLYVILFHLPLPTVKNSNQIRWNFLIYLVTGVDRHPQTENWLRKNQ